MHQLLNRVRRPKIIPSDVSLLNHGLSGCFSVLGIVRLPFKCCPSRSSFWTHWLFLIFAPICKMERKSFTQIWNWTLFTFCQLIMSNLTLVFGFEFERFPSIECDWNIKISRIVQNLGFWKDGFFSQNLYDYCQCKSFCHIMDSSQTDVKIIQGSVCRTVKST